MDTIGISLAVVVFALVLVVFVQFWAFSSYHRREQDLQKHLVELLHSRSISEYAQAQRTIARGLAEQSGMRREKSEDYGVMAEGIPEPE